MERLEIAVDGDALARLCGVPSEFDLVGMRLEGEYGALRLVALFQKGPPEPLPPPYRGPLVSGVDSRAYPDLQVDGEKDTDK